jgi:hypothetical protein
MALVRTLCGLALAFAACTATAQDAPKAPPELDVLKKLVGDWDATMKFGGMESKGKVTYKMEVGGMWLVSNLESDLFGQKFHGKGLDSYDTSKKKYTSVWIDSMSGSPMTMEGTFDKEKKTMTLAGEGPGMDGKPTKFRSVSQMPDNDTINFSMYMGDGKEPSFTVVYKRRK